MKSDFNEEKVKVVGKALTELVVRNYSITPFRRTSSSFFLRICVVYANIPIISIIKGHNTIKSEYLIAEGRYR